MVLGGERMTGAARLASEAAMRIGAGLCSIAASPKVATVYQSAAPHILYEPLPAITDFSARFADSKRNAAVIGPGIGHDDAENLRKMVLDVLALKKPLVLDADALTVFEGVPETLFAALYNQCVLTPHEGEFLKLFGPIPGSKRERAIAAARQAGAIILLKGAETIIATPDGHCIINDHVSPYLATAGAGDVLAGMIGGLLAQGMESFSAACAAAWIHGDVALRHGAGLIAPDLIGGIPGTLMELE